MKKEHLRVRHNETAPEKGAFLVAEPFLEEAWFQHSVVFLTEHNKNGTSGFIVNKEFGLNLDFFFNELSGLDDIPTYYGGPVELTSLFFLHCLGSEVFPGSIHIRDGIYMGGNLKEIIGYLARGNSADGVIKFFFGYSGWEKGQLLDEIEEDAWMVAPSCRDLTLGNREANSSWVEALKRLDVGFSVWDKYPLNPNFN